MSKTEWTEVSAGYDVSITLTKMGESFEGVKCPTLIRPSKFSGGDAHVILLRDVGNDSVQGYWANEALASQVAQVPDGSYCKITLSEFVETDKGNPFKKHRVQFMPDRPAEDLPETSSKSRKGRK